MGKPAGKLEQHAPEAEPQTVLPGDSSRVGGGGPDRQWATPANLKQRDKHLSDRSLRRHFIDVASCAKGGIASHDTGRQSID